MARQISQQSAVRSRQSVVNGRRSAVKTGNLRIRCLWLLLAAAVMLAGVPISRAESPASKNKEGNRLFSQGKYGDAEKAYLDAQVKSPGRPEILYNLGNSLIKQQKYDQGAHALRQSMSKGGERLKENSWFNAGNALFLQGNYKDSAEAFIQALKLDSADRDAKHNLEMALMKLKQQQQKKSDAGQKQNNSENQSRSKTDEENRQQAGRESKKNSGKKNEPNDHPRPDTNQASGKESSISREQALQILQAVEDRELEEQRKLLERRAVRKPKEKDW